jgi:hypothetical protein
MTGNEITLGGFGISVILSIILRMIYGTWEIGNRAKPWIAVGLGIAFAIVAMLITVANCSGLTIATYCVQGLMTGATATGLYELTKKGA